MRYVLGLASFASILTAVGSRSRVHLDASPVVWNAEAPLLPNQLCPNCGIVMAQGRARAAAGNDGWVNAPLSNLLNRQESASRHTVAPMGESAESG